jgi:hypothetical protein
MLFPTREFVCGEEIVPESPDHVVHPLHQSYIVGVKLNVIEAMVR